MSFVSKSKAFVQSTLLPEGFRLKILSCQFGSGGEGGQETMHQAIPPSSSLLLPSLELNHTEVYEP